MLKREGLDWDNNVQAICFSRSSFPVYRTDVENIWEFYTLLLLMENGKLIFLLILLRWIANPPPPHTRQKKKKGKLFEGILSTNVDLWIQSSPVFNKQILMFFLFHLQILLIWIFWFYDQVCMHAYKWLVINESIYVSQHQIDITLPCNFLFLFPIGNFILIRYHDWIPTAEDLEHVLLYSEKFFESR